MNLLEQPIWKLVELCAKEMAAAGKQPFTRGDLIRCLQSKNPRYGPNAINPVIQGITDNLQGGATGTVGKDILHSVGRGLFVLRSSQGTANTIPVAPGNNQKTGATAAAAQAVAMESAEATDLAGCDALRIAEYEFRRICAILPECNPDGTVHEFMPQAEYANHAGLALHDYGTGPFCKFSIPRGLNFAGVYAITVNGKVKYIGECENLSARYNAGYGNISPRNCYKRGQPTNCRINNLILGAIKAGSDVRLWFLATSDHKAIEKALRKPPLPCWNRI